ncbi:hypothetical protein CLSAB_19380 [Clostridium saccharobutylicum]|uniref:hypothetical protein n=1 Tax=Clostridium saccharobutylicum TaxID=169679 RepID=UPI00098C3323|nr:hypothetical protein [Clostridium saccharobutylicum]OOM17218.1 hypothetical protein CLSAB_19380 [Clostridium saccharobutylicum]
MLTETTITLYNQYITKDGKKPYAKAVIERATWHGETVETISTTETSKGSLFVADTVNIRIPIYNNNFGGKSYIEPKAWIKLSDADRPKYFTIQLNDRVVKGICAYEYSELNPITNLDKLDNVATILSKKVNNFGSNFMQHYRIVGK